MQSSVGIESDPLTPILLTNRLKTLQIGLIYVGISTTRCKQVQSRHTLKCRDINEKTRALRSWTK